MIGRLVLIGCLMAAILAGCTADFLQSESDGVERPGRTTALVERVVDGDTVVLSGLGKSRLIGVDTPEVYGGVECFGREASAYAKRLLTGRTVRYRLGVDPRDRYQRALIYLWLDDGRFFNAMLVQDGYAQPLTIPPNVDHAEQFVALARHARTAGRGLWHSRGCVAR
ncbi:MAG: thermonuclease family protein [Solirubrobacteraceae bacterium]